MRRQPGTRGRNGEPDRILRRQIIDAFDPAGDVRHDRAAESRLGDPGRSRPNEAATEARGKREPTERAAGSSTHHHESRKRECPAETQESRPLGLLIEREPGRDSAAQANHDPGRKLRALGLEELPAPREARKSASSNSPEHAVEEALPLC